MCWLQELLFQKHCIIGRWIESLQENDLVYVFDADVLPYRDSLRLDNWHRFDTNFVFYIRCWSEEIMAGNYVVRNNALTRNFLVTWATYERFIPPGFSSADNGAIHLALLVGLGYNATRCHQLYNNLTEGITPEGRAPASY